MKMKTSIIKEEGVEEDLEDVVRTVEDREEDD